MALVKIAQAERKSLIFVVRLFSGFLKFSSESVRLEFSCRVETEPSEKYRFKVSDAPVVIVSHILYTVLFWSVAVSMCSSGLYGKWVWLVFETKKPPLYSLIREMGPYSHG